MTVVEINLKKNKLPYKEKSLEKFIRKITEINFKKIKSKKKREKLNRDHYRNEFQIKQLKSKQN